MALQPKIIACGKTSAAMSMVLKFLVGPLLFAATSAAVGIRGVVFKVGIIQVKKKIHVATYYMIII
jgi:auxin efflux carrier family